MDYGELGRVEKKLAFIVATKYNAPTPFQNLQKSIYHERRIALFKHVAHYNLRSGFSYYNLTDPVLFQLAFLGGDGSTFLFYPSQNDPHFPVL